MSNVPRQIDERDQWLFDAHTNDLVGVKNPTGRGEDFLPVRFDSTGTSLVSGDGSLLAFGELAVPVTLTATGTAKSAACEFGGFVVRAVSGTVNVTIYDATSATGTPIMTSSAVALGAYPWSDGRWRENSTGCHVVISGGGTVTLDVLAQ